MLTRLILSSLAIGALLFISPVSAAESNATAAKASPARQQPIKPLVFEFTDSHNQKVALLISERGIKMLDPKGKSAILMFFIYSGTPCRNELQLFTRLKPRFKDLEFVAFELKGLKPDQLREFEKELKLKGVHLIDTTQAMPFAQFIAKLTKWQGSVPLLIAIDKKGNVKLMQLGAMSEDQLKKLAETLK